MSLTDKKPDDFNEKSVRPDHLAKAKSNLSPDALKWMINDAVKHFYIPFDRSKEQEVIDRAKQNSTQIATICREVANRDRLTSGDGLVNKDAMRGLLRKMYRDNFIKEFSTEELVLILTEVHVEVALDNIY